MTHTYSLHSQSPMLLLHACIYMTCLGFVLSTCNNAGDAQELALRSSGLIER